MNNSTPSRKKILAEQARILHRQVPSSLSGGIIASSVMVVILWNASDIRVLMSWFIVALFASALRFRHYCTVEQDKQNDGKMVHWLGKASALLALSSVIWGSGLWLFYDPDNVMIKLALVLFICVMISGSIGPLSSYFPAYLCYSIPMVVVTFIKLLFSASIFGHIFPVVLPLFLIINIIYVRNLEANYIETIKLRFANNDLISQLQNQQVELKKERDIAQESKEVAIDANKRKSQFINAACHDLAQPLYSMGLFLNAMQKERNKDESKFDNYLTKSNECVSNMSNLFNELMDISKFDSGLVTADKKLIDIMDLLDPIIMEFELRSANKGLTFESTLTSAQVFSDSIMLQRIVRNLLDNALTYTHTGSIGLSIQLDTPNKLKIEITDTGIGIPEAELSHIFDEFYQLNNPKRHNDKGRGLGLAIVKRLTKLLDISVHVSSEQGKGTKFWFELPVKQ